MFRWITLFLMTTTDLAAPAAASAPLALECRMSVQSNTSGHWLRFRLRNPGDSGVWLLRWGSPFEGQWMAPFARVYRGDQALPYTGAKAKRGEPEVADYLHLAAKQSRQIKLRLDDAYVLGATGPWRIEAQWRWHDVLLGDSARPPRVREQQQGWEQDCGSVTLP